MPRGSCLRALLASSLLVLSLALAPQSLAASYETRGAFVESLLVALHIQPQYPTKATFSDVPASSKYYGYVEAAAKLGIASGFSNGSFGVGQPLTRAEAAKFEVVAYGDGSLAGAIHSTRFSDNARIPTALVGYVAVAVKLGLLHGFADGSFQPNGDLTTAQEADLIAQLKTAIASRGTAAVRSGQASVSGKQETVLTTASGMTLYYFTPDSATKIACTGSCATIWPPLLLASGSPTGSAGVTGKLSVLQGPNGRQVLYNGHPLYTFSGDSQPGQANGEGLKGIWFVATPSLGAPSSSSGSYSSGNW